MKAAAFLSPYPIFRLTIPLAAGIFLSDSWLRSDGWLLPHLVLMGSLGVLLAWLVNNGSYKGRWLFGAVLCLFLMLLGSFLVQMQWRNVAAGWDKGRKGYRGLVLESPKEREKTVSCKTRVDGKEVLLYLHKDSLSRSLRCGDEILFYAEIRMPRNSGNPYEFDYASYLLRKQVSGTAYVYAGYWRMAGKTKEMAIRRMALACKEGIVDLYKEWGFSGQELAVLSALTVGDKDDLSAELRETYSVAGISHVLALSGLHIGILWGLLAFLLRPLARNVGLRILKWVIVTLMLWGYAFVAGLPVSVIRAVIMCMLVELGQINGNKTMTLNTLSIAAFLMLLYDPFYLFDVGFQLSFLSVWAIILFYPRLYGLWAVRRKGLKYLWGIVSVSVAAQLGTAPLVMYYFAGFPVYFLLANVLIAPLMVVIMYVALLTFLVSSAPFLHWYVVVVLEYSIRSLNGIAGWVSRLPSSSVGGVCWSAMETALLYGILGGVWGYWHTGHRKWLIGLLAGTALLPVVSFWEDFSKEASPAVVFYSIRDHPAVHFIEADKTSYLQVGGKGNAFVPLERISRTSRKREKLPAPRLLSDGYESQTVWTRHGITQWHGIRVCMLADDYWHDKAAEFVLDIDYMYLCKGYQGKIAPLRNLFRMKSIVLDASLGAYRLGALKEECRILGIDYIDMSEKGSFHIFL